MQQNDEHWISLLCIATKEYLRVGESTKKRGLFGLWFYGLASASVEGLRLLQLTDECRKEVSSCAERPRGKGGSKREKPRKLASFFFFF